MLDTEASGAISRCWPVCCFICFLITGIFLSDTPAEAQPWGLRVFGRADGYNATVGYNLYQDQQGFIWAGTDNGALRFDGNSFKMFGRKEGLTDLDVLDCAPYGSNHVLITPVLNNLAIYTNGVIRNSNQDKVLGAVRNISANKLFYDRKRRIAWLLDRSNTHIMYRFSDEGIQKIFRSDSLSLYNVSDFIAIGRDAACRLYRIYLRRDLAKPFVYSGEPPAIPGPNSFVFISPDGKYLISFRWKEQVFDIFEVRDAVLAYKTSIHIDKPISRDCYFKVDDYGNVWVIVPRGGMYFIGGFFTGSTAKKGHHLLKNYNINDLIRDEDGGVWMTTQNGCLLYMSERHLKNALQVNSLNLPDYIPRFAYYTSDSALFFSYANIDLLSFSKRGNTRLIPLNDHFSSGARSLAPVDDHHFVAVGNSLACIDTRTCTATFQGTPGAAKDVCVYNDSLLLLAHSHQAVTLRMTRRKGRVLLEPYTNGREFAFSDGRTFALLVMPDKRILIGTPAGLLLKEDLYGGLPARRFPVLSHANITDIVLWTHGRALIGTTAPGLFLYDSKDQSVREIISEDDITHNSIRSIYIQNDSICWLSTDKGALRLVLNDDGTVRRSRNYTFYDGLPSDNVTSVAVAGDTAYITTINGLGALWLSDPGERAHRPPRLILNSVKAYDTLYYQPGGALQLPGRRNSLLLTLSAIAYESMGNIGYFYKLEGQNDQWIQTNNPEIRFSALPPGSYRFCAYAVNAFGIRSGNIVQLKLYIRPTVWQSIYFKGSAALLSLTALFLLLRFLILKKERERQEQHMQRRYLAELELEAIKAQINPHFIYNCLNSIQYLNYRQDHMQAQKYVDVFSGLIRMTMDYAQQSFISIREELRYLEFYLGLEKLRLKERLQYRIEADEAIDPDEKIPAMLLQPYVENALKHGIVPRQSGGKLEIRILKTGAGLQVHIADDGPGLPAQDKSRKSSLGLRLSGTRAESYNRLFGLDISVRFSGNDNRECPPGAIVIIDIPHKKT